MLPALTVTFGLAHQMDHKGVFEVVAGSFLLATVARGSEILFSNHVLKQDTSRFVA